MSSIMITTNRLDMKPWILDDAQEFFELTNDEAFNAFSIKIYRQPDLASAKLWISEAVGKWAVRERATGLVIGLGGLTPWSWEGEELTDITYRLRSSAQGKGFGLEMALGLRDYALQDLQLTNLTATITPDNQPSIALAKKLGFKYDKDIVLLGVPTQLFRLVS